MSLSKKIRDLLKMSMADSKQAVIFADAVDAASNQETADYFRIASDFLKASDYTASDWSEAIVGSGTRAVSTSEVGGALVITNSGAMNDLSSVQLKNNFQLQLRKPVKFEARVKLNDVLQGTMFIGLQSNLSSNHRVGFEVSSGSAAIKLVTRLSLTNTSVTSTKNMVNNTYVLLRWEWDGISAISYYVDDVQVGLITTNIPVNQGIAVTAAVINLAAFAEIMTVDFFEAKAARR